MEENINIAKILKDKPVNTKLYSPLYGDVYFSYIGVRNNICVLHHRFTLGDFFYNGRYTAYKESEIMLFPSKDMRDWSKFTWKRGDVLISDCGFVCIFKEWASDDYTRFNGCYFDGMSNAETAKYSKLDNNTTYGYIRELEKRCGGVLNLKTLKIEKPVFKDGDIVFMKGIKGGYYANCIFILKSEYKDGDERAFYYAFYNTDDKFTIAEYGNTRVHYSLRPATDSEKQQLFDALAKKGKAWDAEKKQIVDLKPKCEFKPFDKVLGRNEKDAVWEAELFSHYKEESQYPFCCIGFSRKYCIPYNEETAHLLGTTDDWKGGEQ